MVRLSEKAEYATTAKRLKFLRIKKGISRRAVARTAGIDHTRYGAMETKPAGMQMHTLLSIIHKVYKLSLSDFCRLKVPNVLPPDPVRQGTGIRKKRPRRK
ncbi:MAG: hypothetical protein JKX97_03915 [Candidatus Lindowbacteria bacterium]|nr:hypothetical protein [Candidatus Lindowbacteria bacterium]